MDRGVPLLQSLFERDEAVDIIDGERGDVVLITRWGYANRFSQRSIDVQGSSAIDLEAGDEIVTALPLTDDTEILVATASGYTIRRDTTQIPTRTKPGGTRGKRLIRAQDVLAAYPYAADDQILYLTYSGKLVIRSTSTIPATNRLGQGTLLQDLRRDPAAAIARIPRDLCP
jgi:DNA gyrase/topoisomerase IV subunit A